MRKKFIRSAYPRPGQAFFFPPRRGTRLHWRSAAIVALAVLPLGIPSLAQEAEPPVQELGTVTIKAQRPQPEEIQQVLTPGAVSIVEDPLEQGRSVGNLSDAMRYVPGVWAPSSAGGDNGYLSIRGSNLDAIDYDNDGVSLLQDGLPVSSADGANHNRFPDPQAARRMVISRGANALTYGASELGGAINFISRTARNSDPMHLSVDAGSHGRYGARASVGGISASDRLDGLMTLETSRFDGWREHSRQRRSSVHGNLGLKVSPDLDLRLFAAHVENDQQLPGGISRDQFNRDRRQANASNVAGNHQLNVRSDRLAGTGHWRINGHSSLDFGLSFEEQALYHPIVYSPFFSLLIDTRQRTLGGMLRYQLQLGAHDIIAGLNLARTTFSGENWGNDRGLRGPLQDRVDQRATTGTLYALDRWAFAPDWTLVYGMQGVLSRRHDNNIDDAGAGNTAPRGQRDRFSSLNPRLGLIRDLESGNQIFASISRTYQAPNSFDLDNARMERGADATLKAMHGLVYEVGMRGDNQASADEVGLNWDVSLYWGRLRNEIISSDDPNAPGNTLTANARRTTHAGVEALLGARFPIRGGQSINPLISATYNHFRFDGHRQYGNNHLPNAPRYAVHGEVMYRSSVGVYGGPTFDAVGMRYADYSNSYRVGSYGLLGLRAGVRRQNWELFVEGRNLLNRHYVSTLTVQDRAAPDATVLNAGQGRSVYAGLRMHF